MEGLAHLRERLVARRQVVRSPVRLFVVLAFVLSWPIHLYGFGWYGYGPDAVLMRCLLSYAGMSMVALSALIVRLFVEGKRFEDAGWNPGRPTWYLAALLFCLSLWLAPSLIALLLGQVAWNGEIDGGPLAVVILSLAGPSVVAGFGEEFGWRGYLLPRLLSGRYSVREVLSIVGIVWGVWHAPIALGPLLRGILEHASSWTLMIGPALLNCVQMTGACMALSLIFGALWLRTQSIFLLSFFHGCLIGIRDATAMMFVGRSPISVLVQAILLIAAWLVASRWLGRYERGQSSPGGDG
jgi:membrane protease YdiL (CAAX protease family)